MVVAGLDASQLASVNGTAALQAAILSLLSRLGFGVLPSSAVSVTMVTDVVVTPPCETQVGVYGCGHVRV